MRNIFKSRLAGLWLLLVICFTTACGDDDSVTDSIPSGITMAFKTTGGDETEYIINQEDISTGEISAEGRGIEQTGWRFYYSVGKTLFASGYSADNQCAGYVANDAGQIVKQGEFIFENALEMFGKSDDNETFLAMEIPRAGFGNRRLHFIDVSTTFVNKIVGTRIFESEARGEVAWPTALEVRGDKLFVPFHKLDAQGSFSTTSPDTAFVAIYDYPEVGAEPIKIISDSRTSNIGVNGMTTGVIEVDNGDLYSFSSGSFLAGFYPTSTKPSGILRIPNGDTEFDEDYFFNITQATNGGNIFWMDYIGDEKVIARILINDLETPEPSPALTGEQLIAAGWYEAYGRSVFNQKLVIIDLVDETITDVADVPLHAKRFTSPVLVEDGKVYVSIETATDAFVYTVDIETATATKGAEIKGKTIKGFYRL